MGNKFSKRSFLAISLGTMLEYYDFTLFGIFLPLIAPLFFPSETPYDALIKGFYAALIASLMRPLGGLAFGWMGDRLGRRRALLASMYGIAFATIFLGLIPTYSIIGAWAWILLILAKSIQVFCFGGEYNGAGIYSVEHAQNKQEATIGSLLTATTLVGGLLSSLVGLLITQQYMPAWSWRLAFILGGLMGIVGIISRKNLSESPHFIPANMQDHSLILLIKNYPFQLLAGLFIGGFATVPFTTVCTFLNPVLMTKGIISAQIMMSLNTIIMVLAIITLISAGMVADKTSPMKVMRFGSLLLSVLSFPLLWLIDHANFYWLILAEMSFIIINEIFLGPANACLKNLFPMQFRYRGASLSFTIGMSLFGSVSPLIEHYLYNQTGSFMSISFWLMFIGIGAFFSLRFTQKFSFNAFPQTLLT